MSSPGDNNNRKQSTDFPRSKPQDIPAQPRRGSFFEWAFGGLSPTAHPQVKARPRIGSLGGISPDEALNLSRAGYAEKKMQEYTMESKSATSTTSTTAASATTNTGEGPRPIPVSKPRKRSGSSYEGIGLVAAFSGGPSSF
ncbi:hypothetical protein TRVA0_001S03884 [Trichomonascus vanleenenianus]|uniref:uncharacterized protein n=1 Tax=Trichomonascus vanleenenianus TaxID=2268995 RepID=UPI003ECA6F23